MYFKRGSDRSAGAVSIRAKPMQGSANQSLSRFETVDTESGEIVAKYLYMEGHPKQYRFGAKEPVRRSGRVFDSLR